MPEFPRTAVRKREKGGARPTGAAYPLFARLATSLFSHFHRSMARGVAHTMKAQAHFQARRPAFVARSTARSNQGSSGLFGGIFARVQATAIAGDQRNRTPQHGGLAFVRRLQRQGALRRRLTLLRRLAKAREFIRDPGALAAFVIEWRARSLARAVSSAARRSLISALSAYCRICRMSSSISRTESSTWSAMASYSASNLSRCAVTSRRSARNNSRLMSSAFGTVSSDKFPSVRFY